MTSTTSYKNVKQGASILKWNVRSNLTIIIIYLSLILFFGIIYFAGGLSAQTFTAEAEVDYNPWIDASIAMASMTTFLSFVFMIVLSIKEFSYLHNKRKTDMFGSLPISRRALFITKSLSVFLISAVPMTVVMLILMLVSSNASSETVMHVFDQSLNVGDVLLRTLLNLSANIAFIGFLSVCCGKTSEKVLSYIIINGAYPVGMFLLQLLPSCFLYGYTMDFNEYISFALCPAMAGFAIGKLYWLGFTAVFFAFAVLLVRKRKAESAQSHFAYKAPQLIVKLIISFSVGLAMAYLFVALFSDTSLDIFRFWLGMIIGSFLSFFVVQLIFAGGFKRFGKSLIPYVIMVAAFAAVFAVITAGCFGYNSYVPKADEIKSVSFINGTENMNHKNELTDKKDIEAAIKLHKEIIEKYESTDKQSMRAGTFNAIGSAIFSSENGYSYEMRGARSEVWDDMGGFQNYSITYTLNNGATVTRRYGYLNGHDFSKEAQEVYNKGANPLFMLDESEASKVEIYNWGEEDDEVDEFLGYDNSYFEQADNRLELIKTVKEEYGKYGMKGDPSDIEIDISYGKPRYNKRLDYYEDEITVSLYVPETYKKTLALIKKGEEKE